MRRKKKPTTPAGRLYLALALRNERDFFRWRQVINNDKTAAEDTYPILYEAFRELVQMRFGNVLDRREIVNFLEQPRRPIILTTGSGFPLLEAEALIRSALGERGLVSDIPGTTVATIRMQMLVYLVEDLGMSKTDVRDLIMRAEQYVAEDKENLTT